ncbi:uncharacterized protein [Agelaius tricolor]|uniref:uncharacterized protein n=1 Tax=Agelaius tricolor TaxID=9191 RepID=UPI0039F204B5
MGTLWPCHTVPWGHRDMAMRDRDGLERDGDTGTSETGTLWDGDIGDGDIGDRDIVGWGHWRWGHWGQGHCGMGTAQPCHSSFLKGWWPLGTLELRCVPHLFLCPRGGLWEHQSSLVSLSLGGPWGHQSCSVSLVPVPEVTFGDIGATLCPSPVFVSPWWPLGTSKLLCVPCSCPQGGLWGHQSSLVSLSLGGPWGHQSCSVSLVLVPKVTFGDIGATLCPSPVFVSPWWPLGTSELLGVPQLRWPLGTSKPLCSLWFCPRGGLWGHQSSLVSLSSVPVPEVAPGDTRVTINRVCHSRGLVSSLPGDILGWLPCPQCVPCVPWSPVGTPATPWGQKDTCHPLGDIAVSPAGDVPVPLVPPPWDPPSAIVVPV